MTVAERSTLKMERGHSPSSSPLTSEEYVEKVMPPLLRTRDLTAIFLVTIFWITNAATAASGGATAYVYWILGGIVFFLPSVLATAQLGVLFPHEGSIYQWTHKALGPYWGFFAGLCWWFPIPLILVSGADTIVTYIQGLNPAWLVEPWQQGLAILAIIACSGVIAVQRTQTVQYLINAGVVLILFATVLIGISGGIWLLTGHPSVTSFVHQSDWQITPSNMGLFSLITLAYLGSQIPLNMGGEMMKKGSERRKQVTRYLLWGALLVCGCYFIATFALLVIEGPTNGATPFALISAVDKVFGKTFGGITAVCIMAFFVIAIVTYNVSFARMLLVGSIDQRLPVSIGSLNSHRVPANAIKIQTLMAGICAILVFVVGPYVIQYDKPANLAVEFFNVSLAVVAIIWSVTSLFFYMCLLRLYRTDRDLLRRHQLFPMFVFWCVIVVGFIGCLMTMAGALFYSWIPSLITNTNWSITMGGLLLACFVFAAIASMMATSEAAWQRLRG